MLKSKKNYSKKGPFLFLIRIIFLIDSYYRRYFYHEVSNKNLNLIQLDEHPNLLQIEAICETEAKIIYITEYCNVRIN
jgi:hypothetical protein